MVKSGEYKGYRTWGDLPLNTVVLHGGPGAAGSVTSLARELGEITGVLEPFQTGTSIQAQLEELEFVIRENGSIPIVLVCHSWGAWLGLIFASNHPELVKKLILIGTPPFEVKYVSAMKRIREARITKEEKDRIENITESMKIDPKESFRMIGELMSKIDSCDLLPINDDVDFRPDIYSSIWKEAEKMRNENLFVELITRIECPIIAFHGDYDPHPWQGVKFPLEGKVDEFKFILFEKCGHYPWKEKFARELFLEKLMEELKKW